MFSLLISFFLTSINAFVHIIHLFYFSQLQLFFLSILLSLTHFSPFHTSRLDSLLFCATICVISSMPSPYLIINIFIVNCIVSMFNNCFPFNYVLY